MGVEDIHSRLAAHRAVRGANPGSALERFQQARDLARKKLDESSSTRGVENRSRLADLVKRKQAELSPRAVPGKSAIAEAPRGGTPAADPAAYGRTGNIQRMESRPGLGRNIDIVV